MTDHDLARRSVLAAVICVGLAGCSPDVQGEAESKVDRTAAGGTQNRDNSQAGINSTIAPPGQGSALSDTTAGRLPPAGVSGPTGTLSGAAPASRNGNAQTMRGADTSGRSGSTPRASGTPAPRTP